MSTVLCKGGMHHVPAHTIVMRRNGRRICSACLRLIKDRVAGIAQPVPQGRAHPALPNPQFRVMPK